MTFLLMLIIQGIEVGSTRSQKSTCKPPGHAHILSACFVWRQRLRMIACEGNNVRHYKPVCTALGHLSFACGLKYVWIPCLRVACYIQELRTHAMLCVWEENSIVVVSYPQRNEHIEKRCFRTASILTMFGLNIQLLSMFSEGKELRRKWLPTYR